MRVLCFLLAAARPAARLAAGLEVTGVCSDCGAVFFVDEGHSCSRRSRAAAALRLHHPGPVPSAA